jgi:methylthioribose-1-phosphate isomerase
MTEPGTPDGGDREAAILEPTDSIFFHHGRLRVLDQTALPNEETYLELLTPEEVADAIRRLAVRGAMAIGVAGAYGVLLAAETARGSDASRLRSATREAIETIAASRPTARNLFWALERMEEVLEEAPDAADLVDRLHSRADEIALDTIETNRALVEAGQRVVPAGARILTHCNSGPLAALRYGTAVGIIIEAHRLGKDVHAYVDETRPLLQGARITAWEMGKSGVPYTLIPDGAAAVLMKKGLVDLVITGADRIASNGDSANKIGTYAVAVLAREHRVPFYIAAPGSTVDLTCPTGLEIVIEERDPEEVRRCGGRLVAPPDAPVFNPSFDVTPGEYIAGIITEQGVLVPPYGESLGCFAS